MRICAYNDTIPYAAAIPLYKRSFADARGPYTYTYIHTYIRDVAVATEEQRAAALVASPLPAHANTES